MIYLHGSTSCNYTVIRTSSMHRSRMLNVNKKLGYIGNKLGLETLLSERANIMMKDWNYSNCKRWILTFLWESLHQALVTRCGCLTCVISFQGLLVMFTAVRLCTQQHRHTETTSRAFSLQLLLKSATNSRHWNLATFHRKLNIFFSKLHFHPNSLAVPHSDADFCVALFMISCLIMLVCCASEL